jgi:complement component 1 Q subcomponent-binding protein
MLLWKIVDSLWFVDDVGPVCRSLDENLQKQFKKFLEARGIDGNLADYLSDLMEDKEKREYSRWLQNIEAFVKK